MTPFKTLHKGFDGLDVAFRGSLQSTDIEILEAARKRAEHELGPVLEQIGPGKVAMHIAESGARGGYAFRADTGPLGETWFFKRTRKGTGWNIRVSAKALPLAVLGIRGVWNDLGKKLLDMGVGCPLESMGRIDYAADFLMPAEFELEPDNFVAHSKASITEHDHPIPGRQVSADQIQIHLAGRRASSVTIGKMPGRQIIVYDKRREALQRHKLHWFDIWNVDPKDRSRAIWRVEIRAGKPYLKFWQIRTFADLENQFGDLVDKALKDIRYVSPRQAEKNISRQPLDKFWKAVRQEFSDSLFDFRSGILPSRIVQDERETIQARYASQLVSLVPGAMISKGYSEAEAERCCAEFAMKLVQRAQLDDPARFRKKLARAKERLHFI